MSPARIGKTSASPIAFHPRRPPIRNDTSAKPSRSTKRATTEAAAGVHMRAQTHDELPLIISASNPADSGTRTAKYMASPRRARVRVSLSPTSGAGETVMLNSVSFRPLTSSEILNRSLSYLRGSSDLHVALVALVALVAQVSSSYNDEDHRRDAKDNSYAQGLIVDWEIMRWC